MATAYPTGLSSFGVPVLGSGIAIPVSTGNYWFVSSTTGSNGNDGKTPQTAFATVKYAISMSTVSNGDVIVMMPYHVETISVAGGWTPLAGTSIIGLGWGGAKPVISLSATTSTILCSAANLLFQNFRTTTTVSEVVTVFSISAADVTINAVDHIETGTYTCISWCVTSAAANRTTIMNCRHQTTTAPAGTAGWITFVGNDGCNVVNNTITITRPNNAASYVVGGLTTASTNLNIEGNLLGSMATGTALIALSLYSGSTGLVSDNRGHNLGKTAIAGGFALASATGFNNYTSHTANKCGLLDPVVDA
jgi:hypothetical protein